MNLQTLNPLRWSKSFLAILLGVFIIVWFTFIDTYSLLTRYKLHRRYENLETKTTRLKKDTKKLKKKIKKLDNDPALLERIAREQYGMKKKGETIYKIKPKK